MAASSLRMRLFLRLRDWVLVRLCPITSLESVSISTEERCGAAILFLVGIGNAMEGEHEGGQVFSLSCVVRVISLRR